MLTWVFAKIGRSQTQNSQYELRNLYSLRFTESEVCLPLFDYETQTEHKKPTHILFIVTTSEFSNFGAQNRELSTNLCSRFLFQSSNVKYDYNIVIFYIRAHIMTLTKRVATSRTLIIDITPSSSLSQSNICLVFPQCSSVAGWPFELVPNYSWSYFHGPTLRRLINNSHRLVLHSVMPRIGPRRRRQGRRTESKTLDDPKQTANWGRSIQSFHEEVGTGGQCSMWVWRARTDSWPHHQQLPTTSTTIRSWSLRS